VKIYYCLLIASGAFLMLHAAEPSLAKPEKEVKLHQNITKLEREKRVAAQISFATIEKFSFKPATKEVGSRKSEVESTDVPPERLYEKSVGAGLAKIFIESDSLNTKPALSGVRIGRSELQLPAEAVFDIKSPPLKISTKSTSTLVSQSPIKSKNRSTDNWLTLKPEQLLAQTQTPPATGLPQPQVTIQESGNGPAMNENTTQVQGTPANTSTPGMQPAPATGNNVHQVQNGPTAPGMPQPQITIEDNGNPAMNGNPTQVQNTPVNAPMQPGTNMNADPNAQQGTDILEPTTPEAPVLPRAVAPPVGDIAISNIDPSAEAIDLGTSAIVPRLVLRQAPAREVLAVLARYAGLNLVFTDPQQGGQQQGTQQQAAAEPTVSLDLENEPVQDVFNSVLMVSGLQATRRGRTIFVGSNLPEGARNLISRTLRLNQANTINAGTVLASQGASFQRVVTPIEEIVDPVTQRVVRRVEQPAQIQPIAVATGGQQGGARSPLLLSGLTVTADDRLNSLTLTGEPRQVEIATSMLTQLDARRRQVAVNVKVVDVNLTNTENFNSSFSFGINDTFFLQDGGEAFLRFGNTSPPNSNDLNSTTGRITNPPTIQIPGTGTNNPFTFPRRFLAQLQANITNGNAKILTDPTLVVQEGQEATVRLTERVLESVDTEVDPLSGVRTTTPVLSDAGLTLTVNIERIDDNGFVNLSVSPTVAAPATTVEFDSGAGASNTLTLLNRRELSSGLVRLRDGQTLILSGIIQDSDRVVISKVPLLGDIPLLGALFRSTENVTERAEVIIMLTPQVIDDNNRSQFGFNYNPGSAATEMLNDQGFGVQTNPTAPRPKPDGEEDSEDKKPDNESDR
jgi:type IV pilus assembly protein PilQ